MAGTEQTGAPPGGAAPPPAPSNGADRAPPKEFTVTDERSAGEAIAGLLFSADDAPQGDDDQSAAAQPAADTGAAEAPPTGEDDDQGSGEQAPPGGTAIEPPASWNAEEKQSFSQLPPALQQTIARRESQREAALTRSSQEAAESRRAFEQERNAAVAQRTEYLAGLQKMMLMAAPEAAAL